MTLRFLITIGVVAVFSTSAHAQWWTPEHDQASQPRPVETPPDAADAATYSAAVAGRPLTLPRRTLAFRGSFELLHVPDASLAVGMTAGAAFGITDDIEVSIEAVDLTFSPEVDYNDVGLGGLFRFVDRRRVQVGTKLWFNIPLGGDAISVPHDPLSALNRFGGYVEGVVAVRQRDVFRLETGVRFSLDVGGLWFLSVPLAITVNATPGFYVGLASELHTDFYDVILPLLLRAGLTVGRGSTPIGDVELMGGFPFGYAASDRRLGTFRTDLWSIGIRAQFFLFN